MESHKRLNLATTNAWLYASILFLLAFALGVWGFLATDQLAFENSFYAVYYTLQLVFIDPPSFFYETNNWQLIVASVVLPLFPAVAILKLLSRVFGVQLSLWSLSFWSGHHVFLGAGKLSSSVIEALNVNTDKKILAVDIDGEQMTCNHLRKTLGIRMLEHNVNERRFLRALRLHRADTIYIFTGDDHRNLEIAKKIIDTISNRPSHSSPQRLVINIESTALRYMFSENSDFKALRARGIDVNWLSAQQQAAQELVGRYPPSNYLKKSMHVGIIGDGPLIKNVVGQLIKQTLIDYSVDDENARLDITLFSPSDDTYQQLIDHYPVLGGDASFTEYSGLAPLAHVTHQLISSTGLTPHVLERIERPLDVLYVLEQTDIECVNGAFKAAQALVSNLAETTDKPRIVVGLLGDTYRSIDDLYNSFSVGHRQLFQDISWFHRLRDSFDQNEDYPGETVDLLGRPNSDFYYEKYSEGGNAIEEDLEKNWRKKSEALRDSDRQAGYHSLTKLRFVGFALERRSVLKHVYSGLEHFVDDAYVIINKMLKALENQCNKADKEKLIFDSFESLTKRLRVILETIMIANPEELSSQLNKILYDCEAVVRDNQKFDGVQRSELKVQLQATIEGFFSIENSRQKLIDEAKLSLTQHKQELARIEHRRFVNERIIDGWLCDTYIKNDVLNNRNEQPRSRKEHKLNHTIVDNQTLIKMDGITNIKEAGKDDDIVDGVARVLDDEVLMSRFIFYRLPPKKQVSISPEKAIEQ